MTRPALAVPASEDRDYHNNNCVNAAIVGLTVVLAVPVLAGLALRATVRAARRHRGGAR